MSVYEGMFLLDSARSADWNAATAHVQGTLTRYGATILDSRKWDERRLAYEVEGRKRGVYLLIYFEAPGPNIASMRRDLELSQIVLRYLIVRVEKFEPTKAPAPEPSGEARPEGPAREGQPRPAEGERGAAEGRSSAPAAAGSADAVGAESAPAEG